MRGSDGGCFTIGATTIHSKALNANAWDESDLREFPSVIDAVQVGRATCPQRWGTLWRSMRITRRSSHDFCKDSGGIGFFWKWTQTYEYIKRRAGSAGALCRRRAATPPGRTRAWIS